MKLLVIDDEENMRHMLSVMLTKEGYDVTTADSAETGLKTLAKHDFDFILCDIKMPGLGGLGFLEKLASEKGERTVVMMSAYGTIDTAVECMKLGAYDFISKPFKSDEIMLTIEKAAERERLKVENKRLRNEVSGEITNIVTKDKAMDEILGLVKKVASYDTTVLITGESGTGKELIARALHSCGAKSAGPFVAVNCGAIPRELLESELFGHVRGAFTGASKDKPGLFEVAAGGTIFLDEVGELPLELQVKLLRVLEERELRRVGGTRDIKVTARVVAATGRDVEQEIKEGNFREDLFYRLNVISVKLPPLRDRGADIPMLAEHFVSLFSAKFGKEVGGFSAEALALLSGYRWPGNVRELENVIERAVILEDESSVGTKSLPFGKTDGAGAGGQGTVVSTGLSIKKATREIERELIAKALSETGGNKSKAAKLLEISHRALLYKIKNYEL